MNELVFRAFLKGIETGCNAVHQYNKDPELIDFHVDTRELDLNTHELDIVAKLMYKHIKKDNSSIFTLKIIMQEHSYNFEAALLNDKKVEIEQLKIEEIYTDGIYKGIIWITTKEYGMQKFNCLEPTHLYGRLFKSSMELMT